MPNIYCDFAKKKQTKNPKNFKFPITFPKIFFGFFTIFRNKQLENAPHSLNSKTKKKTNSWKQKKTLYSNICQMRSIEAKNKHQLIRNFQNKKH